MQQGTIMLVLQSLYSCVPQPLGAAVILVAGASIHQDESATWHNHAGAAEPAMDIATIGISGYNCRRYIHQDESAAGHNHASAAEPTFLYHNQWCGSAIGVCVRVLNVSSSSTPIPTNSAEHQ